MKKTLLALALLGTMGAAVAQQDLSAQSSAQSGSQAGAQSGSIAAGNVVVFNPGSAGATATGAGGIPTTRVINERSGTDRTEQVLSGTTTSNQFANVQSRAEQVLSGGTNSTENVKYSGTIDNRTSGGTFDVVNQNVHYSGTQTIKNVPGIAMSGPASGPCTGASGGLGIAGPGFGVGLNGAKVDDGCTVRENTRILGQLMQSLDSADPLKMQAKAALSKSMLILEAMNDRIGGDYVAKADQQPTKKAEAPAAEPTVAVATPIMMPATNIASNGTVKPFTGEATDPYIRARQGLAPLPK